MLNGKLIKSVVNTDTEFLENVKVLYNIDVFDLDPTYSKGNFYKGMVPPKLKSDLNPIDDSIRQADCTNLPIASESIGSIVFDPPFMFGTHGQTKNNIMNKRFTMFDSFVDLETMYKGSLKEFYRILKTGGYLFFKCQDYTDSRTTMTHCYVWSWAENIGFYSKDLFILVTNNGRIYNPNLIQRHARKFHSYWWVFKK